MIIFQFKYKSTPLRWMLGGPPSKVLLPSPQVITTCYVRPVDTAVTSSPNHNACIRTNRLFCDAELWMSSAAISRDSRIAAKAEAALNLGRGNYGGSGLPWKSPRQDDGSRHCTNCRVPYDLDLLVALNSRCRRYPRTVLALFSPSPVAPGRWFLSLFPVAGSARGVDRLRVRRMEQPTHIPPTP